MAGASLSYRRDFSQYQSVNRRAERAKSSFKFGSWKIGILNIENGKVGLISHNGANLLKIIQLISSDPENAVIGERAVNCIEKVGFDDTPALMSAFWPGIGEEQIKCFDRSFGEQVTDGVRTFDIQYADIFQCSRFVACLCNPPYQSINAEKILIRMTLRQFAQERAVTAAKIDVQRRRASKDRERIERCDVCLRDQFDHGIRMEPLRDDSTSQRLKLDRERATRFVSG